MVETEFGKEKKSNTSPRRCNILAIREEQGLGHGSDRLEILGSVVPRAYEGFYEGFLPYISLDMVGLLEFLQLIFSSSLDTWPELAYRQPGLKVMMNVVPVQQCNNY